MSINRSPSVGLQGLLDKSGKPSNPDKLSFSHSEVKVGPYSGPIMSGDKPRKTITVRIDGAIADMARSFVRDQAGKPLYLTLNGLVENAIIREIHRLEGGLVDDGIVEESGRDRPPVTPGKNRRLQVSRLVRVNAGHTSHLENGEDNHQK